MFAKKNFEIVACQVLQDMTRSGCDQQFFLLNCIPLGAMYNSCIHDLESSVQIDDGKVWNENFLDIQLLTDDQASHTLRPQAQNHVTIRLNYLTIIF